MKIAKLTWLHNGNYGSILQALALQDFLINNGYDIIDLDYLPSLFEKLFNWLRSGNSPKLFLEKYKIFKNKKNKNFQHKFDIRNKKFDEFKNKYLKLEKICRNTRQLTKISKKYDLFICGSDQIWSPALLNPVFYFSFVPDEKIKISYAPSFGVVKMNKRKRRLINSYLKRFNYLSIREDQGKQIIKEIMKIDVPVLVDPTLLLNRENWLKYTKNKQQITGNYIFCYFLSENKIYIDKIKEYAKKKNLEVVIVPSLKGPFNTGFKEMIDIGPSEWLSLIKDSKYVFTDSFHGCIFSLIFHKEFALFKRFLDDEKNSENSRIYTLANKFGFKERIIDKNNLDELYALTKVNYNQIDKKIETESFIAKQWILSSLKESEKKVNG